MNALSPLVATSCVALGGALGSVLRYLAGLGIAQWIGLRAASVFPWGTFAINIAGSLAMGLLVGFLARHASGGEGWRLLVGVGLLGGFTTFSSFSMELVLLAERGAMVSAVVYAAASVAGGVGGLLLGLALTRLA